MEKMNSIKYKTIYAEMKMKISMPPMAQSDGVRTGEIMKC